MLRAQTKAKRRQSSAKPVAVATKPKPKSKLVAKQTKYVTTKAKRPAKAIISTTLTPASATALSTGPSATARPASSLLEPSKAGIHSNTSSMNKLRRGFRNPHFDPTSSPFSFSKTPLTHSKLEMSTQSNGPDGAESSQENPAGATAAKKQKASKKKTQQQQPGEKQDAAASLGVVAKKGEDFAKWYSQLVVRSELIDYYDISGCYILRPWAFEIWENITSFLDGEFKKLGVKNASFPLLVPRRNLEKEEDHIEGFAAEVAWVTHSGSTKLEEPVAIRPTSETIMYPAYAKWIKSHRDLPLRLNQWCNVLRWEFKDPTPFIRAREFLWQEGHTAYATKEEADAEVYRILDIYERAYEEILACSVIKGHKTEEEKFAGGDFTTTIEGYIPGSGRGIQAATSHSLGQNFAKMFDVKFQDESGQLKHVWQNSWGFTFRSMGVMIMTHSDDKGLVLPPKIAPVQTILIPITKPDNEVQVKKAIKDLQDQLHAKGIRTEIDDRDNVSPGFKYNHWELKGVPLRIEVGGRDLDKSSAMVARRDNGAKTPVSWDGFADSIQDMLDTMQNDLRVKAKKDHMDAVSVTRTWDEFMTAINKNHLGLVPWCGSNDCESSIKTKSGESAKEQGVGRSGAAKSLCIPFEQPKTDIALEKCLGCDTEAQKFVLFGRSY